MKFSLRRGGSIVAATALAMGLTASLAGAAMATAPSPNFPPNVAASTVYRIAGVDRIGTAIKAAQTRDDWQNNVIVVRDDDFADALSAGPLAKALGAPVLVNPSGVLDSRVRDEIRSLAQAHGWNEHVTIVGGTGAISNHVASQINAIPGVNSDVRLQGADRFQTSVNVSVATMLETGNFDPNVFLATGTNFADAMTAGAAAAKDHGVVILTNGSSMTAMTQDFLQDMPAFVPGASHAKSIIAVGGGAAAAWPDADRSIVGIDRYQTSAMVAQDFFNFSTDVSSNHNDNVGLASGLTWADAVIGASFMANADGPIVLTNPTVLNGFAATYLNAQRQAVTNAFVFGGLSTMSASVATQVGQVLFY